jgi:hypothetical protein
VNEHRKKYKKVKEREEKGDPNPRSQTAKTIEISMFVCVLQPPSAPRPGVPSITAHSKKTVQHSRRNKEHVNWKNAFYQSSSL